MRTGVAWGCCGSTRTVISAGGAGKGAASVTPEEEARAEYCASIGVAEIGPKLLVAAPLSVQTSQEVELRAAWLCDAAEWACALPGTARTGDTRPSARLGQDGRATMSSSSG